MAVSKASSFLVLNRGKTFNLEEKHCPHRLAVGGLLLPRQGSEPLISRAWILLATSRECSSGS